jgi:hypothetical protein
LTLIVAVRSKTTVPNQIRLFALLAVFLGCATAQPNVSQVVMWSTLTQSPVQQNLPQSLLTLYTYNGPFGSAKKVPIGVASNYAIANTSALSSVLSANIAVALSEIPLESPTSGVILKSDPATGAELPVSSTLGPIFTQRAETIGKGKFYIGFTHQNYHFTSLNGQSLNGLSLLFPYGGGGTASISNIETPSGTHAVTAPATLNLALDVRLSQDITFLTYGVTSRFDVSVGVPVVHTAVASTAYNGIVYSGTGGDFNAGDQCWCVNTFTPGTEDLTRPYIGQASAGKTGIGDVILRFKGTVLESPNAVLAIGTDLRLPSGDASNYLGTGTTSVKPFLALSLYSKPFANGIILAPHLEAGWQFSGKSILGGNLGGSPVPASLPGDAESIQVPGAPFINTKGYLPDVFSWAVGTEVALGRRNTVAIDFLGNQVGWVHGIQALESQSFNTTTYAAPTLQAGQEAMSSGLVATTGRTSFGQYSGAFGYKVRIWGNLVATFDALVRFNDAGLTARFAPLYGLGYSF